MAPACWSREATKAKMFVLWAMVGTVTLAHFVIAHPTHRLHVIHVILSGMYLIPIIASAVSFGLRSTLVVTAAISLAYYGYIRVSWPNQPMENANQLAMVAVYWIVAVVSGVLVNAQERERRRRVESERRAEREAVIEGLAGLSNALRARDEYTREHSEHVSRLAVEIGRRRGLNAERLEVLRLAGLAHDIGKIGVRDDILLKSEEFTPTERAAIERHPLMAAEILRPIHGTREIAEIVLAHHECPDGSGYPLGRKSEQIPAEAHILRAADVFASLVERRSYKLPMQPAAAMEMMKSLAGTKLDLASVLALEQVIAKQP